MQKQTLAVIVSFETIEEMQTWINRQKSRSVVVAEKTGLEVSQKARKRRTHAELKGEIMDLLAKHERAEIKNLADMIGIKVKTLTKILGVLSDEEKLRREGDVIHLIRETESDEDDEENEVVDDEDEDEDEDGKDIEDDDTEDEDEDEDLDIEIDDDDREYLNGLLKVHAKRHGRDSALEILGKFGLTTVKDVTTDDFVELVKILESKNGLK